MLIKCRKEPPPTKVWVPFTKKRRRSLLALLLFILSKCRPNVNTLRYGNFRVEGKLMGQAMRKLEQSYKRYEQLRKNMVHSYPSQYSQLKNNNNNDYINIIKNKSKAIREYLSILDKSMDQSYEKVMNEGVQAMNGKKYTVKEVAVLLNVSTRTVEKYISAGKLTIEWGKGRTGKIRLITSEALQDMKANEAVKIEEVVNGNNEEQNYESNENSESVDNFEYEMCIPEKIEPEKKYVTQDQLSAYTVALSNFTESINLLRSEISEVQLLQTEMKQRQDEENLMKRILEVEEKLAAWREESKQKKPLWKRLFSK